MATAFGDGQMPDVRRVLTSPWVLGAAAVALVIGIFVWRRTSGATQVANQVPAVGLQPGVSPGALSTDQLGLATGGLQQDLSNLTAQVSAGFAGLQDTQPRNIHPTAFTVGTAVPRPPGYGTDTPGQPGSGIPIFSDPFSTALLTELPWGSTLNITGPAVPGRTVPGVGNLWEPVQQGQASGYALVENVRAS